MVSIENSSNNLKNTTWRKVTNLQMDEEKDESKENSRNNHTEIDAKKKKPEHLSLKEKTELSRKDDEVKVEEN